MLALDTTQVAAFWPVYKQYEVELATVNDERVGIIQDLTERVPGRALVRPVRPSRLTTPARRA